MKNLLVGLLLLAQGITQSGTGSGSIVGRILNPDGSPAVGVRVAASAVRSNSAEPNRNSASLSPTQTDNAGRYRLEHIPAGRFYVTVGTVESPDYFIVTVSDGVSQEAQDFQWRGVGPALALAIRGRVTDDNGTLVLKPARGAGRGVTESRCPGSAWRGCSGCRRGRRRCRPWRP